MNLGWFGGSSEDRCNVHFVQTFLLAIPFGRSDLRIRGGASGSVVGLVARFGNRGLLASFWLSKQWLIIGKCRCRWCRRGRIGRGRPRFRPSLSLCCQTLIFRDRLPGQQDRLIARRRTIFRTLASLRTLGSLGTVASFWTIFLRVISSR